MALFGIFKKTLHQRFEYKPRYYDEQKERLSEIASKYSGKQPADTELVKSRIKKGFRRRFEGERDEITSENRKANTRVLIILILLIVLVGYFILKYLPRIVALLS